MTCDSATYALPSATRLEDCQRLYAFLEQSADQAVALDCGAVTRLGGLAAQMILMASKSWSDNDLQFALKNATADCVDNLKTLGLHDHLIVEEAD